MLASDATHLYAHIEQGRVFPIVYNVADVPEGYATLKRLADFAAPHRSRPRPGGARTLSGGEGRGSKAGWCGSTPSRRNE